MLKRLLLIAFLSALSCETKKESASANIIEISNSGVSGKAIFIKTSKGIRVIEYNCRFGDPEVIHF